MLYLYNWVAREGCVYLLREPAGYEDTRLHFMAGRLGPGVGVRIGWVAAQGAGFAFGGCQGGVGALQGSARRCGPPAWVGHPRGFSIGVRRRREGGPVAAGRSCMDGIRVA